MSLLGLKVNEPSTLKQLIHKIITSTILNNIYTLRPLSSFKYCSPLSHALTANNIKAFKNLSSTQNERLKLSRGCSTVRVVFMIFSELFKNETDRNKRHYGIKNLAHIANNNGKTERQIFCLNSPIHYFICLLILILQ